MNIQKRIYIYREGKEKMYNRIERLADTSGLTGNWINEDNFIIRDKNPLIPFSLEGDLGEVEKGKLKIFVTTGYRYILLFTLPVGFILYGIMKWPVNAEKGVLWIFVGASACIFIFLLSSVIIKNFKKRFKEAVDLI
jgi:hypothetical protein